ncbi:Sugar or nucleoside kinase, ribokinase family [Lentzea xinjiangensis]|uniref:Sugar or nucleoside kinase, ribokinase family n=1 Tax=Lentzea xinjiangensis TaxID=402600 RepID=A0A1H9I9Z4_9PSEU|nr:sugar kinase [Lentzea xinjiangensis]SEQ71397.1 Sugar or nucleoside kinase, ribokinase family [Lentzea xinjiangensis]
MRPVVVVGDAGLDVVARHAGPIAHGGDVRAKVTIEPGGAGANTAVWLAACGASPVLVARVGADSAGRQVHAELTSAGVRCAFAVDPDLATCCVVVLVDENGQRSMLPDRGANARFSPADLDPGLLAGTDGHLHLSGYVLLDATSRPAGLAVLSAARAAGWTTSVDPQAAVLIHSAAAFLDDVHGVDFLLPNADELVALTGSSEPEAAKSLLGHVGAVVVTSGPDGATWVDNDELISVPAEVTECVDSTGAGDAFDAGFLAAWLSGASKRDALLGGVRAGSRAVSVVGAQPPR